MSYYKRSAAAAVIALSLLAAGCGNAAKDEHAMHAGGDATKTEVNEHSGHTMDEEVSEASNSAAANHSEHSNNTEQQSSESALSNVKLEWRYSPERPKTGEETRIELFLYQASGAPIEKFDINHEKLMHLIVVSEDMTEFNHIHPEYKGKGKFEIVTSFAKSGSYKLFADVIPSGYSQMTLTSHMKVSGTKQAEQPPEKDAVLMRTVDDVAASLSLSSFESGQAVDLTFTLNDVNTQKPITDLQPYLGAIGHVVILSEDLNSYLHVHPKNNNESGPTAEFSTEFPGPGLYKIWGQFQRGGETFIVPFTIEVN